MCGPLARDTTTSSGNPPGRHGSVWVGTGIVFLGPSSSFDVSLLSLVVTSTLKDRMAGKNIRDMYGSHKGFREKVNMEAGVLFEILVKGNIQDSDT